MTKPEREAVKNLHEALIEAQKYLESGRIDEGIDWVRIVARLATKLSQGK